MRTASDCNSALSPFFGSSIRKKSVTDRDIVAGGCLEYLMRRWIIRYEREAVSWRDDRTVGRRWRQSIVVSGRTRTTKQYATSVGAAGRGFQQVAAAFYQPVSQPLADPSRLPSKDRTAGYTEYLQVSRSDGSFRGGMLLDNCTSSSDTVI